VQHCAHLADRQHVVRAHSVDLLQDARVTTNINIPICPVKVEQFVISQCVPPRAVTA
jgi:hypothetical protein